MLKLLKRLFKKEKLMDHFNQPHPKFKLGDAVVAIKGFYRGHRGVVTEYDDSTGTYYVAFVGKAQAHPFHSGGGGVYEEEIELV